MYIVIFKNFYVIFTCIYLGLEGCIIMRRMCTLRNAMHVLYM